MKRTRNTRDLSKPTALAHPGSTPTPEPGQAMSAPKFEFAPFLRAYEDGTTTEASRAACVEALRSEPGKRPWVLCELLAIHLLLLRPQRRADEAVTR